MATGNKKRKFRKYFFAIAVVLILIVIVLFTADREPINNDVTGNIVIDDLHPVDQEKWEDDSTVDTNADFEIRYGTPGNRNLNLLSYGTDSFHRYILQQLYTCSADAEYYARFTDPVLAAVEMLNLGEGSGVAKLKDGTVISEGLVATNHGNYLEEGTYAYVTYTFAKDGSKVEFPMRLIEGAYGLWSVNANAVRKATMVQKYEWEESIEQRFGFVIEMSQYGVYRKENGVLTNIYPYYIRPDAGWCEENGILYFPIDSYYREGYYDYAENVICMLDLQTGEYDKETLSLEWIPINNRGPIRGLSVNYGFIHISCGLSAQDAVSYHMPLITTGKTAFSDDQDAYGAELRNEILASDTLVKISNRAMKETYAYVDLDGDTKAEKIVLSANVADEKYPYEKYPYDYYRLTVGDSVCTGWKMYVDNELTFFSIDGQNIVIALYGYNEFDEYTAVLYLYQEGKLCSIGEVHCYGQNMITDPNKGILYVREYYADFIQPAWLEKAYQINHFNQLEEVQLDTYNIFYSKYEMPDLLVELPVYKTPDSAEVTYIQPQKVDFIKMDSTYSWIYIEAADGSKGWFQFEEDVNRVFRLYYAG